MVRKGLRKLDGNLYGYTGRYSWTKTKAKERAKKGRKKGFSIRILKAHTTSKKKPGYALFVKVKHTPKGKYKYEAIKKWKKET